MDNLLTPSKIKTGLKKVLKTQKYTYQDLASTLDCSLPTAKRILNQEELSLTRLTKIMDWLEISLKDLEKLVETTETKDVSFNVEQDEFLANNPTYFSYLLKLKTGETPEAIEKAAKINKLSTDKYLRKLEQLELIKVTGKGKIKFPPNSPTSFLPQGKLAKFNFEKIIDNGAAFFKDYIAKQIYKSPLKKEKDGERASYSLRCMYLSVETYKVYEKKISLAFQEMIESAKTDEKLQGKDKLNSCVVSIGTSIGDRNDVNFDKILNTFGDITNV